MSVRQRAPAAVRVGVVLRLHWSVSAVGAVCAWFRLSVWQRVSHAGAVLDRTLCAGRTIDVCDVPAWNIQQQCRSASRILYDFLHFLSLFFVFESFIWNETPFVAVTMSIPNHRYLKRLF
jgi:hypothetical protein